MKSMQDWFDAYGVSHVNKTNKAIHWVCVPLIFFSIIGLLSVIPLGEASNLEMGNNSYHIHLGKLLVIFGILFFIRKSISIAVGMSVISILILWIVKMCNASYPDSAWAIYAAIFVLAWVGQFIGHNIEGAKPSFFDDLKFLMIGPAWLLHFIYKKFGIPI